MLERGVVSSPTPPYQNPIITPQYYKPKRFNITAIVLGPTTVVTTTVNNFYVIGQLVRLIIPPNWGSRGLNGVEGYVISLPMPNQVEIDINSNGVDPFGLTSIRYTSLPQILPLGDILNGAINNHGRSPTKPYIPGSFRDISPLGVWAYGD